MRCHFIYARMSIKKKILTNIEDEVEKLELSYVADGNIKYFIKYKMFIGKQSGHSPDLTYYEPTIPFLDIHPNGMKRHVHINTGTFIK